MWVICVVLMVGCSTSKVRVDTAVIVVVAAAVVVAVAAVGVDVDIVMVELAPMIIQYMILNSKYSQKWQTHCYCSLV